MAYPLMRIVFGKHLLRRIENLEGIEHIPKTGATLFVSNHVGWHEPILAYAAIVMHGGHRRIHTLARWQIFKLPVFQRWTGGIPIYKDRQKTIDITKRVLDKGGNVLIYPEGGTNMSNVISSLKTGAARFALASKCKVVPIGMKRMSPYKTTFFPKFLEIFYEKVEMKFGEPIDLSKWYDKEISHELLYEVTDHIMKRVADLADKKYKRI